MLLRKYTALAVLAVMFFVVSNLVAVAQNLSNLPIEEVVETETAPNLGEEPVHQAPPPVGGVETVDLSETGHLSLNYVGGNRTGGRDVKKNRTLSDRAEMYENQPSTVTRGGLKGRNQRLNTRESAKAHSQASAAGSLGDNDQLRKMGLTGALEYSKAGMRQLETGNVEAAMAAFTQSVIFLTAVKKPVENISINSGGVNWLGIVYSGITLAILAGVIYVLYRFAKYFYAKVKAWLHARKTRANRKAANQKTA